MLARARYCSSKLFQLLLFARMRLLLAWFRRALVLRSRSSRGLSRSSPAEPVLLRAQAAAWLELDGSRVPVWFRDEIAASVSPHARPVQACSRAGPQLSAGVRERVWFQWPVLELGEIRQLAAWLRALPQAVEPACFIHWSCGRGFRLVDWFRIGRDSATDRVAGLATGRVSFTFIGFAPCAGTA